MSNPIKSLTKKEWGVWIGSLLIIVISNISSGSFDLLTLVAACIGVTSLIFAAKGMITYLGMTMPMAIWSTITWIRNPSESGKEVAIQRLTKKHIILLVVSGVIVTAVFYKILAVFSTPNIVFSTISVTTSFFAASLTMLRSSYYAVGYAANDVVLIVLWILASIKEPRYLSVTVIFVIFLFFDLYGFISWKKREK